MSFFNTEIHRIPGAELVELKIFLCTQLINICIHRNFQMNRLKISGLIPGVTVEALKPEEGGADKTVIVNR